GPGFQFQGLCDPSGHHGWHQSAVFPPHAGNLAQSRNVRSDALYRRGAARPPSLRLGSARRRRAYVPRAALRLYAGEMLRAAFPAKSQRFAGARLHAGLADVAYPQATRWTARDAVAGWVSAKLYPAF